LADQTGYVRDVVIYITAWSCVFHRHLMQQDKWW